MGGGGGGGGSGGLGKHTITTTGGGDISTVATGVAGYKQHAGFDSSKTGANYSTYSMPQGGYGFIPTGVSTYSREIISFNELVFFFSTGTTSTITNAS